MMLNRLILRYLWAEPLKPLLCHDARYLSLWMCDKEFALDILNNLPRCVAEHAYTTVPEITNLGTTKSFSRKIVTLFRDPLVSISLLKCSSQ